MSSYNHKMDADAKYNSKPVLDIDISEKSLDALLPKFNPTETYQRPGSMNSSSNYSSSNSRYNSYSSQESAQPVGYTTAPPNGFSVKCVFN